jgi:type IV pilus assembly protein PilE
MFILGNINLPHSLFPAGAVMIRTLSRTRGFTLVEILVAVAIIGILAAVAIPTYQSYLVKGNRAAVQAHMMNWANAQTQYLADARTYADKAELETLEPTPEAVSAKYTLEVTVEDSPLRYTIVATPIAGTSQADDPELELDSTGLKSPSDKW